MENTREGRVLLQVRIPESLKVGLAIAAARARTTQAALVERLLRDAGLDELLPPHEQNTAYRHQAIDDQQV